MAESPRNLDEFLSVAALDRELEDERLYADIDRTALLRQIHAPVARLRPRPAEARTKLLTEKAASWKGWLVAATLLLAVIAGLLFVRSASNQFVTGVGEQRSLRLPDGSLVYLNARSQVEIRYDEHLREIWLKEGEALFDVAQHARRPFQVRTRDALIEALGTQFNVTSRVSGTRVAVLEGKVQVSRADRTNGESAALTVGEMADIELRKRMQVASKTDVDSMTAWRQRRLVFAKAPLEEVVEEFNRFNRRPIRLEGMRQGERHYSGTFDADDPQALVAFLEKEPDLEVRVGEEEILIRSR